MKTRAHLKSIRGLAIALVLIVVLGVGSAGAADRKAPIIEGQIVESSWPDRRIAVRDDNSGAVIHFLVPPQVMIAGGADLHRDAAAFQKYLGFKSKVRVIQGRQIRHSLYAAVNILPR